MWRGGVGRGRSGVGGGGRYVLFQMKRFGSDTVLVRKDGNSQNLHVVLWNNRITYVGTNIPYNLWNGEEKIVVN